MESAFAWSAFLGALVGTLAVGVLAVVLMQRSLDRRLAQLGTAAGAAASEPAAATADRFAEVASELVTLARSATDSAISREELHEWHQPDLFTESQDDITETVRATEQFSSARSFQRMAGL